MSLTRLIESASELHAHDSAIRAAQVAAETARTNFYDHIDRNDWRELAGEYERASADLNRIKARARVLRGRIHFDAEVL